VILLHGFPEFWYSWRRQMRALAAAGHRVVAPDQRGYNLSEKPADVSAYRVDRLAHDVEALVRHLGATSAVVAGHDWGGAVAWQLARRRPDLLERLVILNAPHPAAYRRELRSPGQLLRSWYVLFFQLPGLPEAAIRAGDYAVLERILRRDPVRPGAFSDEDVAAYKAALDRPGALTAALNWYRANLRAGTSRRGGGRDRADEAVRADGRITVPTLVLWGMRDRYLSPRLLDGLDRWVEDLRVERIPDASHWVLADAPGRVSRSMRAFLDEDAP
jgi:pimeloyl-ACP methyl ester carboxylesterase